MEKTTNNVVEMTPEAATAEVVEETPKKTYTLRNLELGDAFPMVNIISKIGFKEFKESLQSEEFKSFFKLLTGKGEATDAALEKVGVMIAWDIAGIILANLHKCENDIYSFLGGLSGKKPQEVKRMPMDESFEMIVDIIQGVNFKGFTKVVSKLLK